jgi:cytidylate kinase
MEKFGPYITSHAGQFEPAGTEYLRTLRPAITISHQTGAGVADIAGRVAENLQKMELDEQPSWAVLDQQLIETTLQEHGSPKELARKISENSRFFVHELVDDLLDLQPPSWVFMPQVVATITRLASEGQVILIGHGATLVTARLPNVFHVRLTGSLPKRIERIRERLNLGREAAAKFVRDEDRGRQKYIKAHFHARLDNELLYDLVINTDRISETNAAELITEGVQMVFGATTDNS